MKTFDELCPPLPVSAAAFYLFRGINSANEHVLVFEFSNTDKGIWTVVGFWFHLKREIFNRFDHEIIENS